MYAYDYGIMTIYLKNIRVYVYLSKIKYDIHACLR